MQPPREARAALPHVQSLRHASHAVLRAAADDAVAGAAAVGAVVAVLSAPTLPPSTHLLPPVLAPAQQAVPRHAAVLSHTCRVVCLKGRRIKAVMNEWTND